ncbi:hypothetical protein QR98_0064750 [Sarcoptes scabiei]|uniref:Uncharacterized protein n=1 Tax=Sarcoptes scabiei TaxID=52283 RepID=A0A132AAF5_SARSC|nr:hypothetical protein QR98_0064750 [Sarcoptes scabiei]
MNVKSKYLAINGRANDVGGRILETSKRKTTNANRMDIPKVTFSPSLQTNIICNAIVIIMEMVTIVSTDNKETKRIGSKFMRR